MALRDAAALPVIEQIREDQRQVSDPARRYLKRLEREFLSPGLKVSALVRECGARGTRSLEHLQAISGLAPSEYLLEARGEVALRLLRNTELSIEVIAELSGFTASAAFGRAVRRWYGLPPSKYRENVRAARLRGACLPDPAELRYRRLLPLIDEGADPHKLRSVLVEEALARGIAPPAICEPEKPEQLEAEAARLWWDRLRGLSFAEQRQRLLAGFRFETPALVEHLLRMSREEGRSNRRRGVEIARLALEKTERLRSGMPEAEHSWLMARAWMALGNVHRLAWEHREAEEAFAGAALLLADPAAPSALRAELAYSRCQLRQYQRRFTAALELADEAVALSRDDSTTLTTALLCRGGVWWHLGAWERAAADYQAAAQSLGDRESLYSQCVARQNLAASLFYWGRLDAAREELGRAKGLVQLLGAAGPQCHCEWLEGLLASREGRAAIAETHLAAARAGLERLEEDGHFAIVSLDLAALLVGQLRAAEAVAVVGEALPHLEALQLEGEGLAALRLLLQAVKAGQVLVDLVEKVRASAQRLLGTRPAEPAASGCNRKVLP